MSDVRMNGVFVLNPDYHFKNDYDRIAMYSIKRVHQDSSADWISYIHPVQAMIFNCFSEIRSLEEHCKDISEMFKLPYEKVCHLIEPYIENKTNVYTEWGGYKIILPKNILIPVDKVVGKYPKHETDIPELDTYQIELSPDRMHKCPNSLLFMVTNKCATNCKYCYADKKTKYRPLTTDEILRIIDEARSLRMSYIDVIGGELFCRKDWNVILKKLVDSNLTPNYISTKVPLNEKNVSLLKSTGYDNVVQISLDSFDDDVLSHVIGSGIGYVEKMKHTIHLIEEYGFNIQIDTILTRYNSDRESILRLYDFIKDIKNLVYWEIRVPEVSIYNQKEFKEIKADRTALVNLQYFVNNELRQNSDINIIFSDEPLRDKYNKGKPEDEYFEGGTCGILQNRMFVLPDGKVSVCEQLYWHPQFIIGDLKKQSLCEIWNSDKSLSLFNMCKDLFKNSSCFKCKALEICNKKHHKCFVKVIKAYGEKNWDYPDPRCIYAPKVMSDLIY